jgi:hypothetical protein
VRVHRVTRCDRDVVEDAKPHRTGAAAWWPGGRTLQNALSASPFITRSVASTAAPAARNAALRVCGFIAVSGSRWIVPLCGAASRIARTYSIGCTARAARRSRAARRAARETGRSGKRSTGRRSHRAAPGIRVAASHVVLAAVRVRDEGGGHCATIIADPVESLNAPEETAAARRGLTGRARDRCRRRHHPRERRRRCACRSRACSRAGTC